MSRNAPVERTCARRTEERPVVRITFETAPLTAQRVAAVITIA
jgi:hypothetical protein